MGLLAIMLVIAGFGPSIVDRSNRVAPLTPLVVTHGLLFTGWLLLFVTQSVLVATGRMAQHRRIGILGLMLAVTMLLMSVIVSVAMAHRGSDLSGDLGGVKADMPAVLALALGDAAAFATLVALGLSFRRRPEVHKRLMLMATVSPYTLMGAPLAHLRGHWPNLALVTLLIALLLQFSSVIHDRITRGHVHPVSWWGSLSLFAGGLVRAIVIIPSGFWRSIAAQLACNSAAKRFAERQRNRPAPGGAHAAGERIVRVTHFVGRKHGSGKRRGWSPACSLLPTRCCPLAHISIFGWPPTPRVRPIF